MVVGDIPESADLLVVGGGPGGYTAAIAAAQAGRSVTLVDRDEWGGLGGTCLHVGCIPSKTLIELAEATARARATPGLVAPSVSTDLAAFLDHKHDVVRGLSRGVASLMAANGVRTMTGEVRFTGERLAIVATDGMPTHLEFTDVVVATGSTPVELGVLPFDGERVIDAAGLLAADAVPESVCVVGGGYVGLELGTALAKLGASVTIVEALDRVAATFEPDVSRLIARSLGRLGVTVLTGTTVIGADPDGVRVAEAGGAERTVVADRVVVCVGRRPNTSGLDLERLGVVLDERGFVEVDGRRIAAPHVAAIGDVVAGPALAHKATAEAAVAVDALCGRPAQFAPAAIPVVMFTDPEVATAGLTLAEAQDEGVDATAETFPLAALGRAATMDRREGFVRLVAERDTGVLVGAQLVGAHASELIAEATLAIEMAATLEDLALTIHPHPTLSEGLSEAAEAALGRPIHVPPRPSR